MTTCEIHFRRDPREWSETDTSLQAALVRRHVLQTASDTDEQRIREAIDGIFAKQGPEGHLDDAEDPITGTGGELLDAIVFGADPSREEVRRTVELILKYPDGDQGFGAISPYAIEALCRMGRTDDEVLGASICRWIEIEDQWNHPSKLCPWTPAVVLRALWCAHRIAEVVPVVERGLVSIRDNLDAEGRLGYNDPWGFIDCAGVIDHPIAAEIVTKQLPLLFSEQDEDGGWSEHSFVAFRALYLHGYLR